MRIYLDNNATTPLHPAVLEAVGASLRDVFGNASSIHKEGQAARRGIEDARESVAKLIAAEARDVIFTSGGTESNNAAIFGAAGPMSSTHCHNRDRASLGAGADRRAGAPRTRGDDRAAVAQRRGRCGCGHRRAASGNAARVDDAGEQ